MGPDLLLRQAKTMTSPIAGEKELWTEPYTDTRSDENSILLNRVIHSLSLASRSHNRLFQDAQSLFANLKDSHCFGLQVVDSKQDFEFAGGFDNATQNFFISLDFSADFVKDSSFLRIAHVLVREAASSVKLLRFVESLPKASPDVMLPQVNRYMRENIIVDPQAYGAESASYLAEMGLTGEYYEFTGSGLDERTEHFAAYGLDTEKPQWINYLKSITTPDQPQV